VCASSAAMTSAWQAASFAAGCGCCTCWWYQYPPVSGSMSPLVANQAWVVWPASRSFLFHDLLPRKSLVPGALAEPSQ